MGLQNNFNRFNLKKTNFYTALTLLHENGTVTRLQGKAAEGNSFLQIKRKENGKQQTNVTIRLTYTKNTLCRLCEDSFGRIVCPSCRSLSTLSLFLFLSIFHSICLSKLTSHWTPFTALPFSLSLYHSSRPNLFTNDLEKRKVC